MKKHDGEVIKKSRSLPANDEHTRAIWKAAAAVEEAELLLGNGEEQIELRRKSIDKLTAEALERQGRHRSLWFDERKTMHEGAVEAADEAKGQLDRIEREHKVEPLVTEVRIDPEEARRLEEKNQEIKRFEVDLTRLEGLLKDINGET